MSGKFTDALREEIIREFASRHGGVYSAPGFAREVLNCRKRGKRHRADAHFTASTEEAAFKCWVEEAREFARGIKITYIEQPPYSIGQIRIREVPLVISRLGGRPNAEGYKVYDHGYAPHRAELAEEGAAALKAWLGRYACVFGDAGIQDNEVESLIGRLIFAARGGHAQAAE